MFEVTYGTNLHEFPSRKEAIEAAKEISGEYRGMVNIADEKGRERMVYQAGELVSYDYETRLRRRGGDRPERPAQLN